MTIRVLTEQSETVECELRLLAGTDPAAIVSAARFVTGWRTRWKSPPEYVAPLVAEMVCGIVTESHAPDGAKIERQRNLCR